MHILFQDNINELFSQERKGTQKDEIRFSPLVPISNSGLSLSIFLDSMVPSSSFTIDCIRIKI